MSNLPSCGPSAACQLDKSPTLPILSFELFILLATIFAFFVLRKIKDKLLQRFLIVASGVFIFEAFTAPMWRNVKLGQWAYLYGDVSWILTIGWSTLILSTILLVDTLLKNFREWQRFIAYLLILTFIGFFFEALVVNMGIRTYSPEVRETVIGYYIAGVPLEGFYYLPVFMSLIIAFYKYWSFVMEKTPVIPIKKQKWIRNFVIAILGVLLFELMIEPMLVNAKFPAWSYIYRDITFIMTGIWIVVAWIATTIVDKIFIHWNLKKRFALYLFFGSTIMIPLEAWFITNGFRIYGPSAVANFSGFRLSLTNVPIEITFAIPFYLALIICFIRYWAMVFDNKR